MAVQYMFRASADFQMILSESPNAIRLSILVCILSVSDSCAFALYGLKEKTNVQLDFSDVPGDSYMRLAKYNRDSELLTRTFIILVKEAIKKYPDTIVYEEYCLDGTDRKNL